MSSLTDMESAWPRPREPFRRSRRPEERVTILGAEVDLVKSSEVFHFVTQRLAQGERTLVANHNLHSLFLIRRSEAMRRFFQAAHLIEVDSMPLIFWARLTGRRSRRFHRCTYLDWREEFWSLATERRWRVYFVGGQPGMFERARARILARWPGVTLEGRHGYFDRTEDGAENRAVLDDIARFEPHILFVGMGMPIQEAWIEANLDALPRCAIFPIGGAFDFEAGVQRESPRWMGQVGLEWLFRLVTDPRRLVHRYCVEPVMLATAAVRETLSRGP